MRIYIQDQITFIPGQHNFSRNLLTSTNFFSMQHAGSAFIADVRERINKLLLSKNDVFIICIDRGGLNPIDEMEEVVMISPPPPARRSGSLISLIVSATGTNSSPCGSTRPPSSQGK